MKQLLIIILFFKLFISISLAQEIEIIDIDTIEKDTLVPFLLPHYIPPCPSVELKDSNIIKLPNQYKNRGLIAKSYTNFCIDKKGQTSDFVLIRLSLKDSLNNEIFDFFNKNRINEYPHKVQIFYDLILEKKKDIDITVNSDFVNYIKDSKMSFLIRFIFKDD